MAARIQKILSQWGVASRRQAEKMILAGRVKINDRVATLGDKVALDSDRLEVDGCIIRRDHRPQLIYLLINKPLGVVSTCADPQKRKTVIDLLPSRLQKGQGIHPVGRLDFNSTGALILTNDGALTLNLTHPRYHLAKTYHVGLNNCPTKQDLELWRKGIMLDGIPTLPAKVKVIEQKQEQTLLEIILTEGRNRQIRKVAKQLGFKVISLHRTAIANLTLNRESGKNLAPGEYRHLSKKEVNLLQQNLEQQSLSASAFRKITVPNK